MLSRFSMVIILVLLLANTNAQPKVFILNANHLQEIKNKVQQKDKETLQLLGSLKKQADELMDKRSKLRIDS